MRYVVFEAGSRAGLSAMMFFNGYKKEFHTDDTLLLVDSDETFVKTICGRFDGVHAVSESDWYKMLLEENVDMTDTQVFPADELTRQKGVCIANQWWNRVRPEFYDKQFVNSQMEKNGISVPKTFTISDKVIVKPNSLSAGSKGLCFFDGVCVSERIDIAHEYVVDCFYNPCSKALEVHGRETKLKNGYDKYIRFLFPSDKVCQFARNLIESEPVKDMFVGPCHIQVAEDASGKLYYIEGSKRISGTSLVLLCFGYNPFGLINGKVISNSSANYDEWFSFEQLLQKAWRYVYG